MTSRTTSSAELFSREEREEMRFLRMLKKELREQVVRMQEANRFTQEKLAEHLGYDPAQLSRMLSFDRHTSSLTLFKLMYRLGRRWIVNSEDLPATGMKRAILMTSHIRSSASQPEATITSIINPINDAKLREMASVNPSSSSMSLVTESAW